MNGYAISFDMDVKLLEQFYGIPYNPAYDEIRTVLRRNDFYWIQGSTYLTTGNLVNLTAAMHDLKSIEWFRKSVRDIRGFKVEEWADFTDFIKKW